MNIKPIRNDLDLQDALKRLEVVFQAEAGTPDSDEMEILVALIEAYEQKYYPINAADPIEAIKFRMEQMGYTQSDLANIVGLKSRASEILNRKRKLTLEMIRQIHETLHIPTDVLIQTY